MIHRGYFLAQIATIQNSLISFFFLSALTIGERDKMRSVLKKLRELYSLVDKERERSKDPLCDVTVVKSSEESRVNSEEIEKLK